MSTHRTRLFLTVALVAAAAAVIGPASQSHAAAGRTDGTVIRDWTSLAFAAARNTRSSDAASARLYRW